MGLNEADVNELGSMVNEEPESDYDVENGMDIMVEDDESDLKSSREVD
jgi:hypothetical protein